MGFKNIDGNIYIFKSTDATIPLTFNIDITNSTVYLSAKASLSDTTFILQVSNNIHDDAINGITHIDLTPTDTYIEAGEYYMDIVIDVSSDNEEVHVVYPTEEMQTAKLIILDHPKE